MGCCQSTEGACEIIPYTYEKNVPRTTTNIACAFGTANHFTWISELPESQQDWKMVEIISDLCLKASKEEKEGFKYYMDFFNLTSFSPKFVKRDWRINIPMPRSKIDTEIHTENFDQFKIIYKNKINSYIKQKLPTNYYSSPRYPGIYTKFIKVSFFGPNANNAIDISGVTKLLFTKCIDILLNTYFYQDPSTMNYTMKSEDEIYFKNGKALDEKQLLDLALELEIFGYFVAYLFENGITLNGELPTSLLYCCLNNIDNDAMMACEIHDNATLLDMYFNNATVVCKSFDWKIEEYITKLKTEYYKIPKPFKFIAKGFKNTTIFKKISIWNQGIEIDNEILPYPHISLIDISSRIFSAKFNLDTFISFLIKNVQYSVRPKESEFRCPHKLQADFIIMIKNGIQTLNEIDQKKIIKDLLLFWTSNMTLIRGKTYTIIFTGLTVSKTVLPVSHTCFNQLEIPCSYIHPNPLNPRIMIDYSYDYNHWKVPNDAFEKLHLGIYGSNQAIDYAREGREGGNMNKKLNKYVKTNITTLIKINGKTLKRLLYQKNKNFYVKYLNKNNKYAYKKIKTPQKGSGLQQPPLKLDDGTYRVNFFSENKPVKSILIDIKDQIAIGKYKDVYANIIFFIKDQLKQTQILGQPEKYANYIEFTHASGVIIKLFLSYNTIYTIIHQYL